MSFAEHGAQSLPKSSWCPTGYKPFATCQDNLSAPEHGLFWTHIAPKPGYRICSGSNSCLHVDTQGSIQEEGITCADVFDTIYA